MIALDFSCMLLITLVPSLTGGLSKYNGPCVLVQQISGSVQMDYAKCVVENHGNSVVLVQTTKFQVS